MMDPEINLHLNHEGERNDCKEVWVITKFEGKTSYVNKQCLIESQYDEHSLSYLV